MCTECGLPYPIKLILDIFPETILYGGAVRDLISGDTSNDYDILMSHETLTTILSGFFVPHGYSITIPDTEPKVYPDRMNVFPIVVFNQEEVLSCDLIYYKDERRIANSLEWERVDFDVNSLFMTSQGIFCRNPEMLEGVLNHIRNKQMVLIALKGRRRRKILNRRTDKMIERGWTLL